MAAQTTPPPPARTQLSQAAPPPLPQKPGSSNAAGAPPPTAKAASTLDPPRLDLPPGEMADGELVGAAAIQYRWIQQPWVQDLLPLITSLALHAAILIIGIVTVRVIQDANHQGRALEEQIVIPDATMANEMSGGVENPGIGLDPTRPAAQDTYQENTHPDGWAPEPGTSPVAEAAGGGEGESASTIIGMGEKSFGRGSGFQAGEGDGDGTGSGSGRGKLAPYGAPGGGIPGPRGKLFGDGGRAKTIAFCCDSSGSMIDLFSVLKQELVKAISGLKPIQEFSIVFFADERAHVFENGAMVNATAANIRKANKWLDDLTTSGTSNPIPGLEIAFKSKPDLMYILTDGDFPNNNEVIAKIARLNVGKKTRINTIAFGRSSTDEASESFVKFLTTVANDNGGKFKAVSLDKLD